MSQAYNRVPDPGAGLRLHLNENTAGCAPHVLAAMQAVTREAAAFYPDYRAVHTRTAAFFGVGEDQLLLTNGLDEGIHITSYATLQRGDDGAARQAVIVEPAFDMYAAAADAAGGAIVRVPPCHDFAAFPLEETLAALTPATRIVYLTSPNNPTGLAIPQADIAAIARRLPADALVFLDEAYVDFAAANFLEELAEHPNVVIGRTFAKAYGLAAVRVGAVIADPAVIARLVRHLPPYSLNVFAVAGLGAALESDEYLDWYRDQVGESRELVYAACERLKLRYWKSEANFVLIRVGASASEAVKGMAAHAVFVRDRSGEPGCTGCIRLTAGVVEHTVRGLRALEEVLCGAR